MIVNMPKIVQQGGGWGPIECSVSIDKLGRECKKRDIKIFKYKVITFTALGSVTLTKIAWVGHISAKSFFKYDNNCLVKIPTKLQTFLFLHFL